VPPDSIATVGDSCADLIDAGAEFGIWDVSGKTSKIRIQTGGGNYVFCTNENSDNEDKLRGRLTPCSDGFCSCEVFDEGQNYYMGFCVDADSQKQFTLSFSLGQ